MYEFSGCPALLTSLSILEARPTKHCLDNLLYHILYLFREIKIDLKNGVRFAPNFTQYFLWTMFTTISNCTRLFFYQSNSISVYINFKTLFYKKK